MFPGVATILRVLSWALCSNVFSFLVLLVDTVKDCVGFSFSVFLISAFPGGFVFKALHSQICYRTYNY